MGAAARPALEVVEAVRALLDELDPAQAPARHAVDMVRVFDRIGRIAEVGAALAAARVAESSLWRRAGHRSAAHWMAKETGVGVGEAIRLLDTAEVVATAPRTGQALGEGRVSPRQARAVGRAEKVDPRAGAELLGRAGHLSVTELEKEAGRIEAAASTETDDERAQRLRGRRSLTAGVTAEGMGWGRWLLPMAEHTRLLARIEGGQQRRFAAARAAGRHEPTEAYAADALADLADGPTAAPATGDGAPARAVRVLEGDAEPWGFAKVVVRVDAAALDRGCVAPGEVCEVAGRGPLPVADAWRVIDGGALVAAITTRGVEIDRVAHLGRRPTALQRTALEWMTAGTCAVQGCDSTARLEIDHVADWAATHTTELRELAAVCGHHHDLKTHHGHRFGPRQADGTRRLLPPEGPARAAPAGTADRTDGPVPADLPREARATMRARSELEQPELFDTG